LRQIVLQLTDFPVRYAYLVLSEFQFSFKIAERTLKEMQNQHQMRTFQPT